MKLNFKKYSEENVRDIALKLGSILTNVDLDNIRHRYITGTTDSTANTQRLFKHGMTPRPWLVIPVTGDVYIYDISNTEVDVRSTQTSMVFNLLALG